MKTSFYTVADLGGFNNLKSPEAKAIINALDDKIVFCRTYQGKNKNYIPFFKTRSIPFLFTFLKKAKKISKLMDGKKRLAKVNQVICLPYCFPKTINAYKKRNIKTINIGTSGCGEAYDQLAEKEHKKLGLKYKNSKKLFESLKNSDYIITYSNWFKKIYIKNGYPKEKIYLCPLGVDTKKFKPKEKKDDIFRVICVADFTVMKGLQYLLNAWKKLKLKNAELVLVGKKPKIIKKIIKEVNMNNIKLINHTNPTPYYQNSSLFVLPSLSEGSARVMYEAMACSLPVIVTKNCGPIIKDKDKVFHIVTKETGFIVPIKNSEDIANKLKWSYLHQNELKKMGKNAREHIKKFTWKNYTNRIKKILSMLK